MRGRLRIRSSIAALSMALLVALLAGAPAAQAKFVLLLNGKSVSSLNLGVEILPMGFKAENGLELKCTGGFGTIVANLAGEGKEVTGGAQLEYAGCYWVGAEETCTINDPEGGEGVIKAGGVGALELNGSEFQVLTSTQEYATLYTEGIFCTIPEEEVVTGTFVITVYEASKDATVHSAFIEGNLRLGSVPAHLEAEAHVWDKDPKATWAMHWI